MPSWSFREYVSKDRKKTIYGRSRQPFRQQDGSIVTKSVEVSLGTASRTVAERKTRELDIEYARKANEPAEAPSEITFLEAADMYMATKNVTHNSMPILLEELGKTRLADIDQAMMLKLAEKHYKGRKASTVNRQLFSPVMAVVNFAASLKKCPPPNLMRPGGHDATPALKVPDDAWYRAVIPHLSPKLRALMLLMACHGLRISEAIERTPEDFDPKYGVLHIPTTKNGEQVALKLADPVVKAILAIPDWHLQKWLFGTRHRSNIARAVNAACKKAGVRSFGSHCWGRHSFATKLLNDGESLKFVQDAGRWKDIKMPAMRYGHLEKSRVNDEVRRKAANWDVARETQPDVIPLSSGRKVGKGGV